MIKLTELKSHLFFTNPHKPFHPTQPYFRHPPPPTNTNHHSTVSMSSPPPPPKTQQQSSTYPIPLSPPLPAISKDIELNRAMSASSRSSLYVISKDDVIYEDDWLLVVNKPHGVYCDNVLTSVPHLIQHSSIDSTRAPEFHLANRLDRDTSGVMIITKLHKVAAKLVKAFTEHKIQKTYIALCIGSAPKWVKIRLKSGHGRSKHGAWRVYAASDVGRSLPGGSSVRDMETSFEVISINGKNPLEQPSEEEIVIVEEKSLIETKHRDEIVVRAFPKSGRTHQIRLHCQYLGMPIKGDVKYEGVYEWKGEVFGGHALHAERLTFEHPITGLPLTFEAPLPSWAVQALGL